MDKEELFKKLNIQLNGYLAALDDNTHDSLISQNFRFKNLIDEIETNFKEV